MQLNYKLCCFFHSTSSSAVLKKSVVPLARITLLDKHGIHILRITEDLEEWNSLPLLWLFRWEELLGHTAMICYNSKLPLFVSRPCLQVLKSTKVKLHILLCVELSGSCSGCNTSLAFLKMFLLQLPTCGINQGSAQSAWIWAIVLYDFALCSVLL